MKIISFLRENNSLYTSYSYVLHSLGVLLISNKHHLYFPIFTSPLFSSSYPITSSNSVIIIVNYQL